MLDKKIHIKIFFLKKKAEFPLIPSSSTSPCSNFSSASSAEKPMPFSSCWWQQVSYSLGNIEAGRGQRQDNSKHTGGASAGSQLLSSKRSLAQKSTGGKYIVSVQSINEQKAYSWICHSIDPCPINVLLPQKDIKIHGHTPACLQSGPPSQAPELKALCPWGLRQAAGHPGPHHVDKDTEAEHRSRTRVSLWEKFYATIKFMRETPKGGPNSSLIQ